MEASRLEYRLEPAELADAMASHLPSFRAGVRKARLGFGFLAVGCLALASLSVIMVVPVVVSLICCLAAPSLLRRQALLVVSRTKAMTEPVTVTADAEGVQIETAMSRLRYAWRNYESVVSSPAGVGLIGRGGTTLRWIPARAFASDDDRENWAAMARQGVKGV